MSAKSFPESPFSKMMEESFNVEANGWTSCVGSDGWMSAVEDDGWMSAVRDDSWMSAVGNDDWMSAVRDVRDDSWMSAVGNDDWYCPVWETTGGFPDRECLTMNLTTPPLSQNQSHGLHPFP
jgi:hypothetical protein